MSVWPYTQGVHNACQLPYFLLCGKPPTHPPLLPQFYYASPLPAGSTLSRMNQALGNDKVHQTLGTYWVCFTFQFQILHPPSQVSALSLRPSFILFLPTMELMNRIWILYNNPELGHQCPWILCRIAEWSERLLGTDIPHTDWGLGGGSSCLETPFPASQKA